MMVEESPRVFLVHGLDSSTSGPLWLGALDRVAGIVVPKEPTSIQVEEFNYRPFLSGPSSANSEPPGPIQEGAKHAMGQHLVRRRRWTSMIEALNQSELLDEFPRPRSLVRGYNRLKEDADQYVGSRETREHIWTEFGRMLPDTGRVVLVGHGLGAVIAADVAVRLPGSVKISSLITIASPLSGNKDLRRNSRLLAETDSFPFDRVELWVNVFDPEDIPVVRRGISYHYPVALDVPVSRGLSSEHDPITVGATESVLDHPVVALSVTEGVLGDAFRMETHKASDRKIDPVWHPQLVRFAYAKCLQAELDDLDDEGSELPVQLRAAREEDARRAVADAESVVRRLGSSTDRASQGQGFADVVASALRDHPSLVDLLESAPEHLRGAYSQEALLVIGILLLHEPPLGPLGTQIGASEDLREAALQGFLQEVTPFGDAARPTRKTAQTCRQSLEEAHRIMGLRQWFPVRRRSGTLKPAMEGPITPLAFKKDLERGGLGAICTNVGVVASGPQGLAAPIVLAEALAGTAAVHNATSEQRERQGVCRAALAEMTMNQSLHAGQQQLRSTLAVMLGVVIVQRKLKVGLSEYAVLAALQESLAGIRSEGVISRLVAADPDRAEALRASEQALRTASDWLFENRR